MSNQKSEPVWGLEPHELVKRFGDFYGFNWDTDLDVVIGVLNDIIMHKLEPRDFIKDLRTVAIEDYNEALQDHVRADADAEAEADWHAEHGEYFPLREEAEDMFGDWFEEYFDDDEEDY